LNKTIDAVLPEDPIDLEGYQLWKTSVGTESDPWAWLESSLLDLINIYTGWVPSNGPINHMLRFVRTIIVAFRTAKEAFFRVAKDDDGTVFRRTTLDSFLWQNNQILNRMAR